MVPTFMIAAYSSDMFGIAIKAQEAEISTIWDATAYRLHDYKNPGQSAARFASVTSLASTRTRDEMADFNSYRALAPGKEMLLGRASLASFECKPLAEEIPLVTGLRGQEFFYPRGYLRCRARAELAGKEMPLAPGKEVSPGLKLEQSGVFKNLALCGVGRGASGCVGGYTVLADDWALDDATAQPYNGSVRGGGPLYGLSATAAEPRRTYIRDRQSAGQASGAPAPARLEPTPAGPVAAGTLSLPAHVRRKPLQCGPGAPRPKPLTP